MIKLGNIKSKLNLHVILHCVKDLLANMEITPSKLLGMRRRWAVLCVSSLTLSSAPVYSATAAADNQRLPQDDRAAVVAAINALNVQMQSLVTASIKSINDVKYQIDKSLQSIMTVNPQATTLQQQASMNAAIATQVEIRSNLAQFPNSTLTYSSSSQPEVTVAQDAKRRQDQLTTELTQGSPASDTIYSLVNNIQAADAYNNYSSAKPKHAFDEFFNFGAVESPDAYNLDERLASQRFVQYLTKQYESPAAGINLSELQNTLNQYKNDPTTLGQKLQSFRNSDAFKNYQLGVRSKTALTSVSTTAFNEIIQERTPICRPQPDDTLAAVSQAIGVTPESVQIPSQDDPNTTVKVTCYASPMQVNKYVATHRITDPNWYKEVAADSPATIARKTLIVEAEAEAQRFQLHHDNEIIEAELAVIAQESAAASDLMKTQQTKAVNDQIDSISGNSTTSSTSTPTSSDNNDPTTSTTTVPAAATVPSQ